MINPDQNLNPDPTITSAAGTGGQNSATGS